MHMDAASVRMVVRAGARAASSECAEDCRGTRFTSSQAAVFRGPAGESRSPPTEGPPAHCELCCGQQSRRVRPARRSFGSQHAGVPALASSRLRVVARLRLQQGCPLAARLLNAENCTKRGRRVRRSRYVRARLSHGCSGGTTWSALDRIRSRTEAERSVTWPTTRPTERVLWCAKQHGACAVCPRERSGPQTALPFRPPTTRTALPPHD